MYRCPGVAARVQVSLFQGKPLDRAHVRTSKRPLPVACVHVRVSDDTAMRSSQLHYIQATSRGCMDGSVGALGAAVFHRAH